MHQPTLTTRLGLLVTATAFAGLAWGLAPARGVSPGSSAVGCPHGPSGWALPPGSAGRSVLSANGSDQVIISCRYSARDGKSVDVIVDYALPYSPNPYADTSVCASRSGATLKPAQAWNGLDRLFRVVSPQAWSYAGFRDDFHALSQNDVAGLQQVARTLLQRSIPLAEACTQAGGATALAPKTRSFLLHASAVNGGMTTLVTGKGTFVTTPTATDPVGTVTDLNATDLIVTMTSPAVAQSLRLRIQKPLGFTAAPSDTLNAAVQVVDSNYPSCGVGETGTLTIATTYLHCGCNGTALGSSVAIDLCGRNLMQGAG